MAYRELLIGCGNDRRKRFGAPGHAEWGELVTLDIDPNCGADVEHNLERFPYPFQDNHFDEVHAYSVMEHIGAQGDWRFFFRQYSEIWRILAPDGLFCCCVPAPGSCWIWGDPGHSRFLPPEMLTFLDQEQYTEQVGKTMMTDYRAVYQADFRQIYGDVPDKHEYWFVLQAKKPSRIKS